MTRPAESMRLLSHTMKVYKSGKFKIFSHLSPHPHSGIIPHAQNNILLTLCHRLVLPSQLGQNGRQQTPLERGTEFKVNTATLTLPGSASAQRHRHIKIMKEDAEAQQLLKPFLMTSDELVEEEQFIMQRLCSEETQ
jgi:hypothetical protein